MQSPNLRIEQVEMIRRLRNSGVSLQQISEAYQVFDRLDKEFGSFGLTKVSQSHPVQQMSQFISHSPVHSSNHHQIHNNFTTSDQNIPGKKRHSIPPLSHNSSVQSPLHIRAIVQNHSNASQSKEGPLLKSPCTFSSVLEEVANRAKLSSFRGEERAMTGVSTSNTVFFNGGLSVNKQLNHHAQFMPSLRPDDSISQRADNTDSSQSTSTGSSSLHGSQQDNTLNFIKTGYDDVCDIKASISTNAPESVLREAGRCMLLSANSDQIMALIKKCSMTIPTFDPCQLSAVYGVTDDDVRAFLNGHLPCDGEYGLQIVDWFVNTLINTEWFISDVLKYSEQIMTHKQTEAPDVDFTPRRERFTFRDNHLEVLESHFRKDHYPSQKEKEMIANECNIKMAMASNCELKEKERVTHINVDHWFRNKRKEMIRRTKSEKLNATNKLVIPNQMKPAGLLLESSPSKHCIDWLSPTSTLHVTQPLGNFSSNQSVEIDNALSSPQRSFNELLPNAVSQASAAPSSDGNSIAPSEARNFSTCNQTASLLSHKETSEDITFNEEIPVEVKIEPTTGEEGIENQT